MIMSTPAATKYLESFIQFLLGTLVRFAAGTSDVWQEQFFATNKP